MLTEPHHHQPAATAAAAALVLINHSNAMQKPVSQCLPPRTSSASPQTETAQEGAGGKSIVRGYGTCPKLCWQAFCYRTQNYIHTEQIEVLLERWQKSRRAFNNKVVLELPCCRRSHGALVVAMRS